MASGSSATSPHSNLSSRFSSLKVFKFASKEKDARPPPPPPKDEFYLRNRSMASLLPDNVSLAPHSPMSPQHQFQYNGHTSPEANQSTMSLVSSAASGISSPPPESKSRPQSRSKEKALAFLKFGKRSPRSPSRADDVESPGQDDSISMPWNFQHNIHVDDGLVGMPPSWSMSLAAHGFSEEEIALLHARRVETRSPNSQNLFNARPNSPTIAHPYQPNPSSALLTNPAPRTTSLPRQYSDASLRSGTQSISNPTAASRPPFTHHSASMSTSSLHSSKADSISTKSRLVPQRHPNAQTNHTTQLSVSLSSDSNHSSSGKEDGGSGPYIPPRLPAFPSDVASSRTKTHTINGSTSSSIYSASSSMNGHHRNESTASKRFYGTQVAPPIPPLPQQSSFSRARAATEAIPPSLSSNAVSSLPTNIGQPSRKAANAAPRLSISLHSRADSADLSTWAGALFEGLASGDLDGSFKPTTPQSAPASAAFKSMSDVPPTPVLKVTPATKTQPTRPIPEQQLDSPMRSLPPTTNKLETKVRPLPPKLQESNDYGPDAIASPPWTGDLPSSSSPLWSQLEGILGQPVTPGRSSEEHGPYSAALAETFSPTLPFSPEEERMAAQRRMRTELRAKEALENREEHDDHRLSVNTMRPNRDSSRSSTSTISAAMGGINSTPIVRKASIARRTGAYVIDKTAPRMSSSVRDRSPVPPPTSSLPTPPTTSEERHPPSPLSPQFAMDEVYAGTSSPPASANSFSGVTPTSDSGIASHIDYYLQPSPDPSQSAFSPVSPVSPAFREHSRNEDGDDDEDDEDTGNNLLVPPQVTTTAPSPSRPTIVIDDAPQSGLATALPSGTPLSPFQRYRGWLSEVVAPLEEFIDEAIDPRDHYLDLKEIAEGESGSVYSARLIYKDANRLRLPPLVKAKDAEDIASGREILVAIKSVAIVPSGSPKLNDLRHELTLMRGLCHENLISLDALYVDLIEDTLWIRMELMERSLADVVALVDNGLMLQDRTMARFASDILHGLDYLQQHNIAHRDIRSDNLLLNKHGVLKITDFASAVQVSPNNPMRDDPAGVLYWQAPELRSPPYNALKIDVWSLGATVWEMSETQPPFADTNLFADRWPSVQQPEIHSPAFHDFLQLCSEPAATRPSAAELLNSAFIKNACGRPVIVHLLSQCLAIEASFQD